MPPQRNLAVIAALALFVSGCGDDRGLEPGGPAPPEASAETDCEELGGGGESAPPVRQAGKPPYGFNDHAGLVRSIGVAEDAELLQRAGATLWRVAIDWRFAEPEPGVLELETHDAIYCEGLARGIRPVFHITGAPDWAADQGECPVESCIHPPAVDALDDLAEFAGAVAERYPDAAAIEAWNEPNLANFWSEPDPHGYADVLAATYDGVKEAVPSMPVLGGSLSNTSGSDATRHEFAKFLAEIYEAGAAEHMDGLAFHPYPIAPLGSPGERFRSTMAELRRTMRAAGEGGEPIWVTEVGLPVEPGISEADQARTMRGIYGRLAAAPDVEAVIFHTLLDDADASADAGSFGWIKRGEDGDLEPRPVYEEFGG